MDASWKLTPLPEIDLQLPRPLCYRRCECLGLTPRKFTNGLN